MNKSVKTNLNVNNNSLLEQIRALSFVKTELELYLDTHPNCATALDYYARTIEELEDKIEEYTEEHGPIRAEHSLNSGDDTWSWVNTPWPWQTGTATPKEV